MGRSIDVIVVTYNCEAYIGECLRSLRKNCGDIACNLFIVDNSSSDRTVEIVESGGFGAVVIRSPKNGGFAYANNLGIRAGQAPYVLLLNPDTVIEDAGVFARMVDYMDTEGIDILGPKLLNKDGSLQRWAAGFTPTLLRAFKHYFFIANIFKKSPAARGFYISEGQQGAIDVDWVCGASLMLKRSVVDKIGLLNEDFFMYAEDMEFCSRAKGQGLRLVYATQFLVVHLYGLSSGKALTRVDYQSLANLSGIFRKKRGFVCGKLFDMITFLGFFLRCIIYMGLSLFCCTSAREKLGKIVKLTRVAFDVFLGKEVMGGNKMGAGYDH